MYVSVCLDAEAVIGGVLYRRCSVKEDVLRNFAKFTGKLH